ncbi:rhodanese-like domain-containing protein [Polaribacter undariae]|uniref:Rhodanese-like domain-containing protein n=1 Tax=Polaribacter sejongensis TaxID=985043 RepID=A0AAJ1VFM5_9FLAO|nr:rhodanese-like domain-containing protein [Polaribacter undariae]MDN3618434.1 rhodanese-like domain-containing protein [Polaribacter undariae]UWD30583.1 rhodanese-like domain-containing protein [Polaribacter undariae]
MKNIFCLLFMGFFFINCNSQEDVKSISTQELKELLSKEEIQLMDVRTPKEVKEGAIETASFSNFFDTDFHEKAALQLDKSKPVYLYCRSGKRSVKASKILKENGYEVYNVLGGYNKWKQEN